MGKASDSIRDVLNSEIASKELGQSEREKVDPLNSLANLLLLLLSVRRESQECRTLQFKWALGAALSRRVRAGPGLGGPLLMN